MFRMNMIKTLSLAMLALALTVSTSGNALADHHEGMDPHAGHDHAMADAGAASCPGCGMDGGLCAHCVPMASEILSAMSAGMCPMCEDPSELCEKCSANVSGSLEVMATLNPQEKDVPAHDMVCLAMTLSGDFEAMYGELFALGAEQGLLGEDMMTGSILPDAAADIDGDSAIYVAFNQPDGAEPQDPLFSFHVPAGDYLAFRHDGPDPGLTWMAAYTWLAMSGIEVAHAPAGEHHMGAPDEAGNMLMDIYIPVAGADGMDDGDDMEDEEEAVDPHAGHNHD